LLRLSTIFGTLHHSMLNCFNSSRVGLELVPEITRQDLRKKLGIQFILVATDPTVVKTFDGFDNIPAYKYGDHTIEADIVDVTTLTQINEMSGIHSLLCQAKILGGALSEPLDKMLKDMEKAQN